MFMFRSRKTNLSKRLVKARKRRGNEARRSTEDDNTDGITTLLKRLQENQLEMLLRAIESTGKDLSSCVLMPQNYGEEPHVLCCQTWRWPDLMQGGELKRLPMCRSASDPVYICCNPYHWSRLCQIETPPPPYSRTSEDRLKPEDRAPSEERLVCRDFYSGSVATSGDSMNSLGWCKLAYWEMTKRVGPPFPVEPTAVNVFGDDPYGDGLNLETLAQHSFSPPELVRQVRSRIGLGVTLSQENGCVWVYNRSDYPVFVSSLTLEDPDAPSATRVPAGHCLCVHDPIKAAQQNYRWDVVRRTFGPIDPNSIKLSFVKGWGQNFSRREIASCPCWIEIMLAPCR